MEFLIFILLIPISLLATWYILKKLIFGVTFVIVYIVNLFKKLFR